MASNRPLLLASIRKSVASDRIRLGASNVMLSVRVRSPLSLAWVDPRRLKITVETRLQTLALANLLSNLVCLPGPVPRKVVNRFRESSTEWAKCLQLSLANAVASLSPLPIPLVRTPLLV